jgi:redox-sensitive bicupin YhaK (pirin superfamily)
MPEAWGPERRIVRDTDRFVTEARDITTRHSFSYGTHYDAARVGFAAVRAINTERLAPGAGYEAHRHADVEIVTWVVEGALRHADTAGGGGVIRPGTVQRLSAGSGVEHTEVNASADAPLVFVQMMLASHHEAAPEYEQVELPAATGELLTSVQVHAAAELLVVRLDGGEMVTVPGAPMSLVHVARGEVRLGDTVLLAGDEAHLTDWGPYDLSATGIGGEVLIWQLETR